MLEQVAMAALDAAKEAAKEAAKAVTKEAAKEVAKGVAVEGPAKEIFSHLPARLGEGRLVKEMPNIIGEDIRPNGTFESGGIKYETDIFGRIRKADGAMRPSLDGIIQEMEPEVGKSDIHEVNSPIKNKQDGLEREKDVHTELKERYPAGEGYEIIPEAYLRDETGAIVRDPVTGEARRIDFVVAKDGKAVDSIEVTSNTADKTAQSAKEARIRDAGGNFIKDSSGNLVEIPSNIQTRIERRA